MIQLVGQTPGLQQPIKNNIFLIVNNTKIPIITYELIEHFENQQQLGTLGHFQPQHRREYSLTLSINSHQDIVRDDLYGQTKDMYILNNFQVFKIENCFVNSMNYNFEEDLEIIGTAYRVMFYNNSNLDEIDNDYIKLLIKQELRLKKLQRILND